MLTMTIMILKENVFSHTKAIYVANVLQAMQKMLLVRILP